MRKILAILLLFQTSYLFAQDKITTLPVWKKTEEPVKKQDWLINSSEKKAQLYRSANNKDIIFSNGLVKRSFRLQPNLACIDFSNLSNDQQLIRAVSPEANLTIDGQIYAIGGLRGQKQKAYLLSSWLDELTAGNTDFRYKSWKISPVEPHVNWKPAVNEWASNKKQPAGKMLTFSFESALPALKGIRVNINYELYDGIPLMCKWLSVENKSRGTIKLNKVINEVIAAHEEESTVDGNPLEMKRPHGIYIESNYAFNNSMNARLSDQTTHWNTDSTYTSQVNYGYKTPCLLEVYPPIGPGIELKPGAEFKSIRTNELLLDSYDRDRNGLAQRMMYRKIAPWSTENPIFMHLVSVKSEVVKKAIDQCAETGYEAIILSFGSGLDMEDLSAENIAGIKKLVDYAHSKGILMGGYSLFSSRRINDDEDVIDPKTGKADVHAQFSSAPCLGSNWGLAYLGKIKQFIKKTGMDIFENDGPYPGDLCASTKHPGHQGLDDSQWAQMELQKGLYRWCNENGVYVNAPDWYFLDGTNKIALGYREVNFSLPREQQVILNRQNIYDGTWEKTPSMSWGFVPLTQYHGGGAAATLEPLTDHRDSYEQLMMQYYGAGIQACYRGPRLYDTEETKALVIRVVNWYKKYRTILNSDIIHLRRPDGRDWDGILHVNPDNKEKGLAMLFNPSAEAVTQKITLPLYYTGLTVQADIREKEGKSKSYKLDNNHNVIYEVTIPANSYTWLVIE
ncbi:alpha-galactosidase [Pedobacter lusitanus]|uniref:Alpha-galactosidase n=1 Tax=Pedobacter lusitanus TaxID=1503925 RepID=A0A0D0GKH6_9SPHI|nr:alpha-galactosidase [Pedobacter lusitanus]KIO74881.1 alpha-galactosidase [Pedobacter lusitanus]